MKAYLYSYSTYDGRVCDKKQLVHMSFASSSEPPKICITWDKSPTREWTIEISPKDILLLILGRLIEKINK